MTPNPLKLWDKCKTTENKQKTNRKQTENKQKTNRKQTENKQKMDDRLMLATLNELVLCTRAPQSVVTLNCYEGMSLTPVRPS
jgi:hypothetical protein